MAFARLSEEEKISIATSILEIKTPRDAEKLRLETNFSIQEIMIIAINVRLNQDDHAFYMVEMYFYRLFPSLLAADRSTLFAKDSSGNNVLMLACKPKAWINDFQRCPTSLSGSPMQLLGLCYFVHDFTQAALHRRLLKEFFSMRNNQSQSIIDVAVLNENFTMLWYLLNYLGETKLEEFLFTDADVADHVNMKNMILTFTKLQQLLSPQLSEENKRLAITYLQLLQKHIKPLPWHLNSKTYTLPYCLSYLFGDQATYTPVQLSIAKIMVKFHSRQELIPYSDHLGREFIRYYQETTGQPIPKLPRDQYDFEAIDVYQYPIPNERFQGFSKEINANAYLEFLMLFLRKTAGWGSEQMNKAIQWAGFVPNEKANQAVTTAPGEVVVEVELNEGLLHGEPSHMLQFAYISLMIQDGYLEPGVTLHDIVSTLVTTARAGVNDSLWGRLLDNGDRDPTSFCNPYMLYSSLMRECRPALIPVADFLINSFCKGYQNLLQYRGESSDQFLSYARLRELRLFYISPDLLQKYLAAKPSAVVLDKGEDYAIIEKKYQPNVSFEPKPYVRDVRGHKPNLFALPPTAAVKKDLEFKDSVITQISAL